MNAEKVKQKYEFDDRRIVACSLAVVALMTTSKDAYMTEGEQQAAKCAWYTQSEITPYDDDQQDEIWNDITELQSQDELRDYLGDVYNVPVTVNEEDYQPEKTIYEYLAADSVELEESGAMREVSYALAQLPPELIHEVDLQNLDIVGGIVKGDATFIDGTYNRLENEVRVSSDAFDLRSVVMHEVVHAIDAKIFCSPDAERVNEELAKVSGHLYGNADKIQSSDYMATEGRHFATVYSATDLDEDRAELLEYTLQRRGIIREGDRDFGSPMHQKQEILLDQLEVVTPGVRESLERQTDMMREIEPGDDEAEFIADPENPNEYITYSNLLLRTLEQGGEVQRYMNSRFYDLDEQGEIIVNSPIIITDEDGYIRSYAWAERGDQGGLTYYARKANGYRVSIAAGDNADFEHGTPSEVALPLIDGRDVVIGPVEE